MISVTARKTNCFISAFSLEKLHATIPRLEVLWHFCLIFVVCVIRTETVYERKVDRGYIGVD